MLTRHDEGDSAQYSYRSVQWERRNFKESYFFLRFVDGELYYIANQLATRKVGVRTEETSETCGAA
jgi:hypothetical protein